MVYPKPETLEADVRLRRPGGRGRYNEPQQHPAFDITRGGANQDIDPGLAIQYDRVHRQEFHQVAVLDGGDGGSSRFGADDCPIAAGARLHPPVNGRGNGRGVEAGR